MLNPKIGGIRTSQSRVLYGRESEERPRPPSKHHYRRVHVLVGAACSVLVHAFHAHRPVTCDETTTSLGIRCELVIQYGIAVAPQPSERVCASLRRRPKRHAQLFLRKICNSEDTHAWRTTR